jgi:hypothetical protein
MSQTLTARGRQRRLWSARRWCEYFLGNAKSLMDLPWQRGAELTEAEKSAVAASIQDFQLGESSEGKHLLMRAHAYAGRHDDPSYASAMELFIREEQRHARDLGRFLSLAEIPLARRTRLDSIFRWLRRRAGLELCITVLLTAETVGTVYYKALRRATGSLLLRRICEQLLRDEVQHVRFHAERLAIIARQRLAWKTWLARAGHRLLFAGSSLAVWLKHRRALRAGGLNFLRYWRSCWREMRQILRLASPRTYAPERKKVSGVWLVSELIQSRG